MSGEVIGTHAAIWTLRRAEDGYRWMAYDGALIKCANCDGFDGLECPRGCGVKIFSNQAERDAKWRREMDEADAERRRYRAEMRERRKTSLVSRCDPTNHKEEPDG